MKCEVISPDPLGVLSSTKNIVEDLQYITVHEEKLTEIAQAAAIRLEQGLDSVENHFGHVASTEEAVQLIFFEDAVNFCFWEEKGKEKWKVEFPKGTLTSGGWYSLGKAFQRAIANNIPVLHAEYMAQLTLEQARSLFEGANEIEIPLLKKRQENLQEAGNMLLEKYDGQFMNALEAAHFDAIEIAKLLVKDFPSFRDIEQLDGKEVIFLKRAQICAQDFSYTSRQHKKIEITNIDHLTAFADYKMPQMLRKFGLISYRQDLADKIDNYLLIPAGSREEIELRAVTIWCVELMKQMLKKYTAGDLDNALWLISQDQTGTKPYHRTYTIYY